MHKHMRLFTPGPTPIFPLAQKAMSSPILYHRSKAFVELLSGVREGLKKLVGTRNEVLILSSSGTGAMEAAILNLCSPGDEVLVIRAGKFGGRWAQIVKAHALTVRILDIPLGEVPTIAQVKTLMMQYPNAKALLIQACETSTGVNFPVSEIAALTKKSDLLLVVDAVSYLGVSPFYMDNWGVDVMVSASQKGLMLPPGLSFVCFNEKAWAAQKKSKLTKYYFDLAKERKAIENNQTAYTSSVTLIQGLAVVLSYVHEIGMQTLFSTIHQKAQALRNAVQTLGLDLFAKVPSDGLVSIAVPHKIDGTKIVTKLRDEYSMTIAGGQDELKGKIIRIACMGYVQSEDLILLFEALEKVLVELGLKITVGQSVSVLKKEWSL